MTTPPLFTIDDTSEKQAILGTPDALKPIKFRHGSLRRFLLAVSLGLTLLWLVFVKLIAWKPLPLPRQNEGFPLPSEQPYLKFRSVPGFFVQSDPATDPSKFDVYDANSSFGLVERHSPDRWIGFRDKIHGLIKNGSPGVHHKVIFIARHGQGFHNVAESQYGTPLWDCHWSEKTSNGNITWGPDARLTSLGKEQARMAHRAWSREIEAKIPLPEILISSPLSRSIETMEITGVWRHVNRSPIIKERWRENIGLHTCDKRRPKESIMQDFPFLEFEKGFNAHDVLWTKDLQETDAQQEVRIRQALTDLFLFAPESQFTYISITAHAGVIASLLRVVGHRPYPTQVSNQMFLAQQTYLQMRTDDQDMDVSLIIFFYLRFRRRVA